MDQTEMTALAVNNTREFIKDTGHEAPDEAHILALLQIPPISDEVAEMEDEASTRRLAAIEFLLPALNSYAKLFATGTVAHERAHLPEELLDQLPEGLLERNLETLHVFGVQLTMGVLAQFVDRGVIAIVPRESRVQPQPAKRRRFFRRG